MPPLVECDGFVLSLVLICDENSQLVCFESVSLYLVKSTAGASTLRLVQQDASLQVCFSLLGLQYVDDFGAF